MPEVASESGASIGRLTWLRVGRLNGTGKKHGTSRDLENTQQKYTATVSTGSR